MYLDKVLLPIKLTLMFGYFHVCDILYVLLLLDTIKLPTIQEAATLQSDMFRKTKWSSLGVMWNAEL